MGSNEENYDLKLIREKLNRSDKLPRLVKSKSDRYMERNGKISDYVRSMSHREKVGSMPNYEIQLKQDISAASYFKQLEKFEASLRNLKTKTNQKLTQFIHY